MTSGERERLALDPSADDAEVGRWLASLEDGRRDTLRELDRVTPEMVDWTPDAPLNSIGTLLYHIGLVEADWVATEILELPAYPAQLTAVLPWQDRDGDGRLWRVDGETLTQHLDRLTRIRAWVLEQLRPMANADFHRLRSFERYDVAPDWVLHHIGQHEAEHRSHIAWLRDTFPR